MSMPGRVMADCSASASLSFSALPTAALPLSGFLSTDEQYMREKLINNELVFVEKIQKNDWICIIAQKK